MIFLSRLRRGFCLAPPHLERRQDDHYEDEALVTSLQAEQDHISGLPTKGSLETVHPNETLPHSVKNGYLTDGSSRSTNSPFEKCEDAPTQTLPVPLECRARYSVVKYLNKGASGFVVLVRDTAEDELKALKFVNRQNNAYAMREVLNQVRLKHPHVIKLDEILMTSDFLILVLEYAEQGDLFTYLKQRKRFSEKRTRWYFQQLIFAVDFCHRLGIINRDIKLENLLLKGENREILKIADFGLSKDESKSSLKSSVGTVLYLAPELIADFGKKVSYDGKKAEVWACGVVLYTMSTGYYPFVRKGERDLGQIKLMSKILHRTLNQEYLEPEHLSTDVLDLIKHMLHPDPAKRYSVDDVLDHPWFRTGLRFNVREYNGRIINHLENAEHSQEGLQEAIFDFLSAVSSWDTSANLLKSEFFNVGRTISDEELKLVQSIRMHPVRLSDSSVVRFSNNSMNSSRLSENLTS